MGQFKHVLVQGLYLAKDHKDHTNNSVKAEHKYCKKN